MKRFLLLALTAGLLSPIAAKAESYWLVLGASHQQYSVTLEKIQMESMEQCLEQGELFRKTKRTRDKASQGIQGGQSDAYFICLKGK